MPITAGTIISSGTLRTEDLIPVFTDALAQLGPATAEELREEYAAVYAAIAEHDHIPPALYEDASWLLNDQLFSALEDHAPAGTYFGAHEGDGACFGFWAVDDEDGGDAPEGA